MARNFQNFVRGFLAYTEHTEAPEIFNYWTAISALAGALQGKVYLDMGLFEWTPASYIILVGPSGSGKSTAINSGMNLLKGVKGIHFGSDTLTWQAMVDEFVAATTGDTNWHRSGKPRRHSSVTYSLAELGTLLNPKDKILMSALTSLWSGDGGTDFKRSTRQDGARHIERPHLNLIAGVTPSWLADNFPASLIGTGFTSRCILVYAAEKKATIAYPKRNATGDLRSLAAKLTEDLARIAKMHGEFTLTEEAYARGTSWYEQANRTPPVGLNPSEFGGYLQRRQAHAHKLALCLSAAQGDDRIVTAKHLDEAILILESTEKAMPAALSGIRDEGKPALRLEEVLRKHGTVNKTELYMRMKRTLGWREFESVLMNLADAGLIQEGMDKTGKTITWRGTKADGLPS